MNLKSINASPEYQKSSDMPDECEAIRYMSSEEIPECVQVIRNAFKTVADEFGITEANAPRFTAFATDEGRLGYHFCEEKRPMVVYLIGGRIVGYYSIAFLNEEEAELNNLSVLPQYRHRSIGRRLVEDCVAKVKETGRTRLKIGIVEENKLLRGWYESLGFVHTGTVKYDFFPFTCGYMEKELGSPIAVEDRKKYYRVHTADVAYITQQPRGIFTAIGKLVDAGILSEEETKEYWENREYFERVLPVPPFYDEGNPDKAVTWFKSTSDGNRIYSEMTFYRKMAQKYGVPLYMSECDEVPGEIIYEDDFQIAIKNQRTDINITTKRIEE